MEKDLNVVWLTNIPTPYSVPVWECLSKLVNLRVLCLGQSEPGRQWNLDEPEFTEFLDSPVLHSRNHATYGPSFSLQRALSRGHEAIVLDGWQAPAYLQAYLHARVTGRRIVMSYWSTSRTHRYTSGAIAHIRAAVFKNADAIVTPGSASTTSLLSLGVAPEKIHTGFAAVDVVQFNSEARRLRSPIPFQKGHRFLYVGQLIERKNISNALKAFQLIRRPGDSFRLVGAGPLENDLRELTGSLGLADVVKFEGHLQGRELIQQYAIANTLVLPSTEEVWGLVLNEALAAGLHAVSSAACGAAESIGSMHGVFLAGTEVHQLASSMRQSVAAWQGYIPQPEILSKTPSAYATIIHDALTTQTRSTQSLTSERPA